MSTDKAYGGERSQVQIGTIYYIRTKVISCKKKLQILTTNRGSYLAGEGFGVGWWVTSANPAYSVKSGLDSNSCSGTCKTVGTSLVHCTGNCLVLRSQHGTTQSLNIILLQLNHVFS